MKNVINYYYQLNFLDIHHTSNYYKFISSNNLYYFMHYNRNIEELNDIYELSNELIKKRVFVHQIIPNVSGNLVTYVNGIPYMLLKVKYHSSNLVTINDVVNFNNSSVGINIKNSIKRENWGNLWIEKIDHFEYQVNKLGKKYPLIRESFSYFVGLAENAISLVNSLPKDNLYLSVCHKRIKKDYTIFDLYNPLNLIIDLRVRDSAEYFKSTFIDYDITNQIKMYVAYNNLTPNECMYFFARMLYSTFYFDLFESIINDNVDEKVLVAVLSKVQLYEQLLKTIYFHFKSMFNIVDIEWLKKM